MRAHTHTEEKVRPIYRHTSINTYVLAAPTVKKFYSPMADGDREQHPESTAITLYSFPPQFETSKVMLNLNKVYLFCQMWAL